MRIFVTGATGYIGRVVTERALAEGHAVYGLSRNEKGDAQLRALGAKPVRRELTSLDVLRQESAQAEAVLHLAYIHDFGMDYEEVLRIDAAAVDALGEPLRGTERALVITSGTAVVDPDPAGGQI
jgi:nucleoside-diphosphate-sugar epimerase